MEEKDNRMERNRLWKWFCWTANRLEILAKNERSSFIEPHTLEPGMALTPSSLFYHSLRCSTPAGFPGAFCLFILFILLFIMWKSEAECGDGIITSETHLLHVGRRLNNRYGTLGMRKLFLRFVISRSFSFRDTNTSSDVAQHCRVVSDGRMAREMNSRWRNRHFGITKALCHPNGKSEQEARPPPDTSAPSNIF